MSSALDDLIDELVASGTATAAEAVLGDARRVAARRRSGLFRLAPPRRLDGGRMFDLASLTKPVMATLGLVLDAGGRLPLATRLGRLWSGASPRLAERTLEDLLRHRSGLLPWAPLYRLCADRSQVAALLVSGDLLGEDDEAYGDLGYVLWGLSVERALDEPLGRLFERHLGRWLGGTVRPAPPPDEAVECAMDTRRERALAAAGGWPVETLPAPPPGVVQDGNARFLGGLAGHAGLFARPEGLWRLAAAWLSPGRRLEPDQVARALAGGRRFALGWGRPAAWPEESAGRAPLFGQLGFTGGCVWAAPERGAIGVLLAHRGAELPDPGPWRRRFCELVAGGAW